VRAKLSKFGIFSPKPGDVLVYRVATSLTTEKTVFVLYLKAPVDDFDFYGYHFSYYDEEAH